MKYYILPFGCQFNKADGDKISAILAQQGHRLSSSAATSDLVVVLMCSVRQKSVDKVVGQIMAIKRQNPKVHVILSGCILTSDHQRFKSLGVEIKKFSDLEKTVPSSGLIVIGKGCNNFCAYCVVPYTRGREKYRSRAAIIKEVKNLLNRGINEITLLAQNVNSYPNFVGLLQKVTALKGDFKVKFLTNHPKDFSDDLIKEMARNPKIIKYVHLPFQAGDNEILRKMNRKYTRGDYLKLIAKIKKAMPDVVITTDIIVGFPGETKAQFQKTVQIMQKVGFKQAFIAKYSPRVGTAAFRLKDNVPQIEKQLREQTLLKIVQATRKHQKKHDS